MSDEAIYRTPKPMTEDQVVDSVIETILVNNDRPYKGFSRSSLGTLSGLESRITRLGVPFALAAVKVPASLKPCDAALEADDVNIKAAASVMAAYLHERVDSARAGGKDPSADLTRIRRIKDFVNVAPANIKELKRTGGMRGIPVRDSRLDDSAPAGI